MPTVDYWRDRLRESAATGPRRFFLALTHHWVLVAVMLLTAVMGWAAWICRLAIAPGNTVGAQAASSARTLLASFALAAVAGLILGLLVLASLAVADDGVRNCLPRQVAYVATAAAFGAGLSLTAFYEWFERWIGSAWDIVTGSKPGSSSAEGK